MPLACATAAASRTATRSDQIYCCARGGDTARQRQHYAERKRRQRQQVCSVTPMFLLARPECPLKESGCSLAVHCQRVTAPGAASKACHWTT